MQDFVYQKKDGTPSKPVGLGVVLQAARNRITTGDGPFTLTVDGEPVRKNLMRKDALDLLERKLTNGDVGPIWRVRNGMNEVVFRVREVVPSIKPIDIAGNAKADFYWGWVKQNFPSALFLGAYVCKFIAGTSTKSQHSFGNAVDFSLTTQAAMTSAAHFVVANTDLLNAEHVIVGDTIWSKGSGWSHYSGDFHYHVHVDFSPNCSSSLPCGIRSC